MFFDKRVPPPARFAYRLDALSCMLGAVLLGLTAPFISVIAIKTLKASAFEISLLTVMPLAGSTLSLVWANMMEGRRKMPFAVFSAVLSSSLFLLAMLVTTSWAFVAMVSVYYILLSISGPAYSSIIKEIYPDSDRGRIMAYSRVCMLSVFLGVSLIAGPLLHGYNYRIVFPIAALFGIASAMSFKRIPANDTHGDPTVPLRRFIKNSLRLLRENSGFRRFCNGVFVAGFANLMLQPLFALYQVNNLHVDTNWASLYAVVGSPVAMIGYVYWGAYVDRRTSHEAVAACTLLLALVPLAYCLTSAAWMVLPIVVLGQVASTGLELGYANGVLQYAPQDKIVLYQGVFASLMGLRGMIAPFVGVLLVQSGLLPMKSVFLLCGGLIFLAAAIQYQGARAKR